MVEISESRYGTRTLHSSLAPFSEPMVNSENDASDWVV